MLENYKEKIVTMNKQINTLIKEIETTEYNHIVTEYLLQQVPLNVTEKQQVKEGINSGCACEGISRNQPLAQECFNPLMGVVGPVGDEEGHGGIWGLDWPWSLPFLLHSAPHPP